MNKVKFFPHTAKYHGRNALLLAKASLIAYKPEKEIEIETQNWGCTKLLFFSRNGTQAFMTGNDDLLILAFRGTEQKLEDWMTDADMNLTDGPGGKVHDGFHKALKNVWLDIRKALDEFRGNGQSIWITGHSLGAALATLAAATLGDDKEDIPVNGIYTFGQPRVGDRTFARNYNQDFSQIAFRFVNNNDVVTRVPPRTFGYRHVGRFLYIDSNDHLQDDIHWWNHFLDRLRGRREDFGKLGTDGIKDHSMKGYVEKLEKADNMKFVV